MDRVGDRNEPDPPPAEQRAHAALDIIDRYWDAYDRKAFRRQIDDAYCDLAAAMDELFGPLPPTDYQPRNP